MTICPIRSWRALRPDVPFMGDLSFAEFDTLISQLAYALKNTPEAVFAFTPKPQNPTLDSALFFATWRLGKALFPISHRHPPKAVKQRVALTRAKWIELEKLQLNSVYEGRELQKEGQTLLIETSSATKIACHTVDSLFTSAKSCAKALHLDSDSVYGLNLPLFHIAGVAALLRSALAGAEVVYGQETERATHLSLIPTQLYRDLKGEKAYPNLRCLLLGGAPIGDPLYTEGLRKGFPLHLSYGMTETGSMVVLKRPYQKAEPLEHVELRLAKDGEIELKGPSLFTGYYGKKKRDSEAWFQTRDLGRWDEEKGLIVLGRKDRQFISGGENIQPEEIEKALLQIPGVVEAKVEPIPDAEFGMRPKGWIQVERDLEQGQIRETLQKSLPKFMIPEEVEICGQVLSPKMEQLSRR